MKTEIKLTLAALLFPLATACAMQSGTEDVSTTDQDITETTSAQPQAVSRETTETHQELARKFTSSTLVNQPMRESSTDDDPTASKKVDGAEPIPNPWDPYRQQMTTAKRH